jgi:hypothetical protein
LKTSSQPAADWGPTLLENRLGRYSKWDAVKQTGFNENLKSKSITNDGEMLHVNISFIDDELKIPFDFIYSEKMTLESLNCWNSPNKSSAL